MAKMNNNSPITTQQRRLSKGNKIPRMVAPEGKRRTKEKAKTKLNKTKSKTQQQEKTLQDSRENGKMEGCVGGV